mmetsp:Transcript_10900/g.36072  ORF Transcript_10900/g.36072 Transcript_10900/m.36072 type:complete len:267 (-) Transcript_10900:203-1003(-)
MCQSSRHDREPAAVANRFACYPVCLLLASTSAIARASPRSAAARLASSGSASTSQRHDCRAAARSLLSGEAAASSRRQSTKYSLRHARTPPPPWPSSESAAHRTVAAPCCGVRKRRREAPEASSRRQRGAPSCLRSIGVQTTPGWQSLTAGPPLAARKSSDTCINPSLLCAYARRPRSMAASVVDRLTPAARRWLDDPTLTTRPSAPRRGQRATANEAGAQRLTRSVAPTDPPMLPALLTSSRTRRPRNTRASRSAGRLSSRSKST